MEVTLVLLLALAIFIVLPALIGFGILGVVRLVKPFRAARKQGIAGLACAMDADCPQG